MTAAATIAYPLNATDYRIACGVWLQEAKAALVAQQRRPFADFDADEELELERQVRLATNRLFHAR